MGLALAVVWLAVVWLIGVLPVLRWRLLDPSILRTAHFPFRYRRLDPEARKRVEYIVEAQQAEALRVRSKNAH
jgi:hypothetical protein